MVDFWIWYTPYKSHLTKVFYRIQSCLFEFPNCCPSKIFSTRKARWAIRNELNCAGRAEIIFSNNVPSQKGLISRKSTLFLLSLFQINHSIVSDSSKTLQVFWCIADDFCLYLAMLTIIEWFVRKVLNIDSNVNMPEKLYKEAEKYLRGEACRMESRREDVWQTPWRFSAI